MNVFIVDEFLCFFTFTLLFTRLLCFKLTTKILITSDATTNTLTLSIECTYFNTMKDVNHIEEDSTT